MAEEYMDCRSCKHYILETKDIPPMIKLKCDKGGIPYHFYKDCDDFEKDNTNEYIY